MKCQAKKFVIHPMYIQNIITHLIKDIMDKNKRKTINPRTKNVCLFSRSYSSKQGAKIDFNHSSQYCKIII